MIGPTNSRTLALLRCAKADTYILPKPAGLLTDTSTFVAASQILDVSNRRTLIAVQGSVVRSRFIDTPSKFQAAARTRLSQEEVADG